MIDCDQTNRDATLATAINCTSLRRFAALTALVVLAACNPTSSESKESASTAGSEATPVARTAPLVSGLAPTERLEPGSINAATTILVLGDSISAAYGIQRSEGWVALLDREVKRLGSEHTVVNASISGETTGGGLARVDQALAAHEPDLVILELGGNDGLRGYPVPRIESNLATIIERSQAAGAEVVLVGMQIPPNYGPRYTQAFAQTFQTLAERYELPLVDRFLEEIALAGNLMQADGIHPTAAAQGILLNALWPPIRDFLKAR